MTNTPELTLMFWQSVWSFFSRFRGFIMPLNLKFDTFRVVK